MIKRVLIAAAIMIATPGFLFSQDVFFSFANDSVVTTADLNVGDTGTAFLFSADGFDFDAADFNLTSSDGSVGAITGGEALNTGFTSPFVPGTRFNDATFTPVSDSAARYFAASVNQQGVKTALSTIDANFVPSVGFLLGSVDFSANAAGSSTFDAALGNQGAILLATGGNPDVILNPAFGSATLNVTGAAIPEPSSAMLLALGAVGLVARRRKA